MPEWCDNCGHWYFMGQITHDANCKLQKRKRWDEMTLVEKAKYVHPNMTAEPHAVYLHELLKDMAKKIEEETEA